MEEITKTFKAFSEDGQEFIIHEYTNFIKSGILRILTELHRG